jgi:hypothetical protein
MEPNSNNGGLLPSAMALKDSLNQKPATSAEPTMLTPSQLELLRQGERELDEYLTQTALLDILRLRFEIATTQAAD